MKNSETLRIGINVGKTSREDRGITVYTRSLLNGFDEVGDPSQFVLLHYPGNSPNDTFGIPNAILEPLPYSDKDDPDQTIINEQVLGPRHQQELGLDVVWHPHNRCQRITPCAYVATMHDVLPIARPELASQYLGSPDKKALYLSRTMTANQADMIITASNFSRAEIIRYLDVDPDKVTTIYSGIDRQTFKPNRSQDDQSRIRTTYALPDHYLLATGSYAPHKNLDVLVEAYAQSDLPKAKVGLVMVGPNDATGYRIGYNQVTEHIQRLGLSDKVRLLPSVPSNDLVSLYSNAAIFATTSLYEGFGFTPLEAMACEVPVVASNTSAIPEVCQAAALYADPQDPTSFAERFNALLEDRSLRQQLIARGRIQVNKFEWRETARKTLDVLKAAAAARQ